MGFISQEDFRQHVKDTLVSYTAQEPVYDLKRFNKNAIDPIKLLLDKSVYGLTWDEVVSSEISRQKDKSNNNGIGYFHQNIFRYIPGCTVPPENWDVIYTNPDGIDIDGVTVHTVYVEMKNKHNTMNASMAEEIHDKMRNKIADDDDCVCMLVEAIAKKSQNVKWARKKKGEDKKFSHRLIRRVSMDEFYRLVTGDPDGFAKVCAQLPITIDEVMGELGGAAEVEDTVMDELRAEGDDIGATLMKLAFRTYSGFSDEG
ncbi:Eco47II family restriction endonuclease [Olsenella sp. YH-ols2217]|uniref:Eco47II family restriction endonuclease n=1 Tax=Kribbibacterium absianum TaxID=3044210 RepID=A0ABT6ZLZ7_9ACTN|nr:MULTISPECIES: Eco47II family restriction endonuclease [unclassified Olsenella]MDJ1121811.1 Eco47II family restriction endonuclease [Olsenella sp. YH-ols2216]MDJ1129819.1 Eco47II family restriction endonuclease [Olsenella sp. YH-ols2217]